jgi:hypothetical protein
VRSLDFDTFPVKRWRSEPQGAHEAHGEAFSLKNPDGTDHVVFIKINDHQFIELYAEPVKNYGFIHDAGFETNDAKCLDTGN